AVGVRVGGAVEVGQQLARLGRELLGEVPGELADEGQLGLVVGFQGLAHVVVGFTECWPVKSSRTVSNATSGAGSRGSRASTRKRTVCFLLPGSSTRVARTSRRRGSYRLMAASRTRPISSRWPGVRAVSEVRSGRP